MLYQSACSGKKFLKIVEKSKKKGWEDFQYFLRERCFPEKRGNKKDILNHLGIDHFDPLQIAEATKGRMAEDNQYIMIAYKR